MEISDSMAEKVLGIIENLSKGNSYLLEAVLKEKGEALRERKFSSRLDKLKEMQKPFIPYDEDEDLGTEE